MVFQLFLLFSYLEVTENSENLISQSESSELILKSPSRNNANEIQTGVSEALDEVYSL